MPRRKKRAPGKAVAKSASLFEQFAETLTAVIAERVSKAATAAVEKITEAHVGEPEAEAVEKRVVRRRRRRSARGRRTGRQMARAVTAPVVKAHKRPRKAVPNRRVEERGVVPVKEVAVAVPEPTAIADSTTESLDTSRPSDRTTPPPKPDRSKDPVERIRDAFRPRGFATVAEAEQDNEPSAGAEAASTPSSVSPTSGA